MKHSSACFHFLSRQIVATRKYTEKLCGMIQDQIEELMVIKSVFGDMPLFSAHITKQALITLRRRCDGGGLQSGLHI